MTNDIIRDIIYNERYYMPYSIIHCIGGGKLVIQINSGLLDAIVLQVTSKEAVYGYKITQEVLKTINVSESALYPVLRRLEKSGKLTSFNKEYMGRNRKYYEITKEGLVLLEEYKEAWKKYRNQIDISLGFENESERKES